VIGSPRSIRFRPFASGHLLQADPIALVRSAPSPLSRFAKQVARMQRIGEATMSGDTNEHRPVRVVIWARLLLILPFIAMLWVSSYDRVEPMIAGIPFFYWYQLGWVIFGAVIIGFIYLVER
jgi:hypothetical protein